MSRQLLRTRPVDRLVDETAHPPLRRSLGLPGLCVPLVAGHAPAPRLAFGVWSVAGLVVYFAHGRRRSQSARSQSARSQPARSQSTRSHSAQGE